MRAAAKATCTATLCTLVRWYSPQTFWGCVGNWQLAWQRRGALGVWSAVRSTALFFAIPPYLIQHQFRRFLRYHRLRLVRGALHRSSRRGGLYFHPGAPMKPATDPLGIFSLQPEGTRQPAGWIVTSDRAQATSEILFGSREVALEFVARASDLATVEGYNAWFRLTGKLSLVAMVRPAKGPALEDKDLRALVAFNRILGDGLSHEAHG